MTNQELSLKILELVGGRENVNSATNCMTRLRIHVKDDGAIQDEALKGVEGVLVTPGRPTRPPSKAARRTAESSTCSRPLARFLPR